jgi:type II secretion system protein N
VGYPAFFLFALLFFAHLTLPYEVIQARVVQEARKQGYQLSMASMGPSIPFSVTAKGVQLANEKPTASVAGPDAPPAPALMLDAVTVRPGLFPPGLHFSVRAFGGTVDGYASNGKAKGALALEVHGSNLELARAGLKGLVGLDMEGKVKLDADLSLNTLEFSKTTGVVKLSGKELVVNGGTVNNIDLPKASLGALDVKLTAENAKTKIDTLALTGGDLEAKGEGDITMGPRLQNSTVKSKIEFKPNEEWLNKYSFIKTGLNLAGRANSSGYYTATLDGMLLSPRANLQR